MLHCQPLLWQQQQQQHQQQQQQEDLSILEQCCNAAPAAAAAENSEQSDHPCLTLPDHQRAPYSVPLPATLIPKHPPSSDPHYQGPASPAVVCSKHSVHFFRVLNANMEAVLALLQFGCHLLLSNSNRLLCAGHEVARCRP